MINNQIKTKKDQNLKIWEFCWVFNDWRDPTNRNIPISQVLLKNSFNITLFGHKMFSRCLFPKILTLDVWIWPDFYWKCGTKVGKKQTFIKIKKINLCSIVTYFTFFSLGLKFLVLINVLERLFQKIKLFLAEMAWINPVWAWQ